MWRFLGILGLFIIAMGAATGIHDGDLVLSVSLSVIMLAVLLPVAYFTIRFTERAAPSTVLRLIKILVIAGVILAIIASLLGMVLKRKEMKSNKQMQRIGTKVPYSGL